MTHTEALAGNTAGVPPTDCTGELRAVDQPHTEEVIERFGGPVVQRVVTVYRCELCGHVVSIAQAGDGPMRLLNSYRPNEARELVEDLARAFTPPDRDVTRRTDSDEIHGSAELRVER